MLGPDTTVVNSTLIPERSASAYYPIAWGNMRSTGPMPLPGSIPASYSLGAGGGGSNDAAVMQANAAPWSFRSSPVPWAIAFLLIGILGLRYIHWRH